MSPVQTFLTWEIAKNVRENGKLSDRIKYESVHSFVFLWRFFSQQSIKDKKGRRENREKWRS